MGDYQTSLKAVTQSSATAYGYTISVWTTGAVSIHRQGPPGVGELALFVTGALAAFIGVAAVATSGFRSLDQGSPPPSLLIAGTLNVFSVGLAFGAAVGLSAWVDRQIMWLVVSAAATAIYLLTTGLELAVATRWRGRT